MRRVTLVVLTHERPDEVTRTLTRTLEQPDPPRVVVVDNGSGGALAVRLATRFPEVVVVPAGRNLGAAGRNLGVTVARTPYVALADDDTWWAPGALRHAAALLDAHPRLAVVTARVLVGPEAREDPTCARMAGTPLTADPALPGHPILGFLAGASVVRRAAFLDAGGFEPRLFLGGEELLLALDLAAAGWGMAYVPELVVHHHPSPRRDGAGRRRLLTRNRLWTAWMRRPAESVAREVARTLRDVAGDPRAALGVVDALLGLPALLDARRVVPPHVEAALRLVETAA